MANPAAALQEAREGLERLQRNAATKSRELAVAITKIQEAQMWLRISVANDSPAELGPAPPIVFLDGVKQTLNVDYRWEGPGRIVFLNEILVGGRERYSRVDTVTMDRHGLRCTSHRITRQIELGEPWMLAWFAEGEAP